MAKITEKMLETLELSLKTQEHIADILARINERAESNALALAKLIDDNSRAMPRSWSGSSTPPTAPSG